MRFPLEMAARSKVDCRIAKSGLRIRRGNGFSISRKGKPNTIMRLVACRVMISMICSDICSFL